MQPDIPGAVTALECVRDELARLHNLQAYRADFDDDNPLLGDLLDLRREHEAVCRAIAALQPQMVNWRDELSDPNAPRTQISFASASRGPARQPDGPATSAPAAG